MCTVLVKRCSTLSRKNMCVESGVHVLFYRVYISSAMELLVVIMMREIDTFLVSRFCVNDEDTDHDLSYIKFSDGTLSAYLK